MAEKIVELKSDIAELEVLQAQARRHKVKDILSLEVRKLVSEVVQLEEQIRTAGALQSTSNATVLTSKRYQVKLNNYAWDQTSKFVKFYITLLKVHTIPEENIHCSFTNKSLELTVKNLDNKDYLFTINNLLKPIDPEHSNWKVKSDMVVVNVAKKEQVEWSHVTELEKRASEAKKVPAADKSSDPSEGLMSIMKNMYEQGDDEMKRTIAKAWTESQQKGSAF